MNNRGKLIVLGVIFLVVGILLFAPGRHNDNEVDDTARTEVVVEEGEVTVEGEIACLEQVKGSPAIDDSCVKGLDGDDGKFYALDTTAIGSFEILYKVGDEVEAVGTFYPADNSSEESGVFEYDGVLKLRTISK